MPRSYMLSKEFKAWVLPKLRPLVDAHHEDARLRTRTKFRNLLKHYMDDYEHQPFAQPNFPGNKMGFNADELRTRAKRFIRNHTGKKTLSMLAKHERSGGAVELNPLKLTCPMELWGHGDPAGIRVKVCAELGVPPDTSNVTLLPEWIGTRKAVLKREFDSLPEWEQDKWRTLASNRKAANSGNEPILTQDHQYEFSTWLDNTLKKRLSDNRLGRKMVVQWAGYYVGEEDRRLHRFRGYHTSDESTPWYFTQDYKRNVAFRWDDFIEKDVTGTST
ncbi:hypothetical protein AURDEDRAFT_173347 [Auricularia subglabra TFB-10046 SS5]|nr:hypothetical protein AURDEDRAFT_173347 [Auricularia subglabra TFB-10046 SS5]